MDVVAQWVHTRWTKQSRSGAGATRRNQLPVGFLLPVVAMPLTHTVVMKEWEDDFAPHSSSVHALPDRTEVALTEEDSTLRVMLESTQPAEVVRRRPPAVRLQRGEWLRWQITYRRTGKLGGGAWHYELDTLNIAYGSVTKDIFLATPPRLIDERTQLTTYHR